MESETLSRKKLMPDEFFDSQTNLTAAKILIYQQYLGGYLPKVLMQYGKCHVVDFFSGSGKNGDKPGSPLILIEAAKNMLRNPFLLKKWPRAEVDIIFNDIDKSCCEELEKNLASLEIPPNIKIQKPDCKEFGAIKEERIRDLRKTIAPKFFFLDPFTYSNVQINDIKDLMNLKAAEVLLFLPVFLSYRFRKVANKHPKLENFLNQFTESGCVNYTVEEFNESIRRKLLSTLNLKYVRWIEMTEGARKNALFYMTTHITGMMLMNNIAWKNAEDGQVLQTRQDEGLLLFDAAQLTNSFQNEKKAFLDFVKTKKRLTNTEIIDVVAQNGFPVNQAAAILKELKDSGQITVEHLRVGKTKGLYISDANWDSQLSIITYTGE